MKIEFVPVSNVVHKWILLSLYD